MQIGKPGLPVSRICQAYPDRVEVRGRDLATAPGVKQDPPLPVSVELANGRGGQPGLADAIRDRLRQALVVQTHVELVPWGSFAAKPVQVETSRALAGRSGDRWGSARPGDRPGQPR
jgi:hypothetical protein